MTYPEQYDQYLHMVETTLERLLPQTQDACPAQGGMPAHLCETMRYSLMAGGKRVRPVLLLAACEMLGGSLEQACVPAAALEMIHTYSLIHDDLPGMDNDDYRRGRLSNHKVYGVGHAILAGDALLNYAYECMLRNAMEHADNLAGLVRAAEAVAQRAGVGGMIAGQSLDLLSEHEAPSLERLEYIHMHKTADLLTAPLLAAASIAGADEPQLAALTEFGRCIGLAFQIDDDLLDLEGDAALLGKQTGMDAQRGKMTWPALAGAQAAREKSRELWDCAGEALACFGERAWFLREYARQLRGRKN
ncbi:MAG: polyprenyl synthetase family protein [Clostridiales bacterium]|nr:polyprenyl synthetase family protein [Clostridiales bacterium]